jgi:hypothetical protein
VFVSSVIEGFAKYRQAARNAIEHAGGQGSWPEDQGTGLIWRLASITRLEERDGGVYAELEAIALSRDIPAAFRLFVTPIVRRVSRESLATSFHQTKIAIDAGMDQRQLEPRVK